MRQKPVIRKAIPADAENLAALAIQVWLHNYATSRSTTQLPTLYVQEPFTHAGIGSALLAEAEALSAQRAHGPLWLAVNATNSRAIKFYAKHGYGNIGVTYFVLGDGKHENFVLLGEGA